MNSLLVKKNSIEDILRKLRLSVSKFNDNEEAITEKHDVWSLKKTLVLHDYIEPFLKILRNYNYEKIHYHDPFSGTGFLKIKGKIMPGTPLIPIIVTNELRKTRKDLFFDSVNYSDIKKKSVELTKTRVEQLKGNLSTIVNAEQGTFRKIVLDRFSGFPPIPKNRYNNAHLVVLDPYGFDVEWDYFQKILRSGAVDVILTFPSELANWTKTMANSKPKLTKMFGSEDFTDFESAEEFVRNYQDKIYDLPLAWKPKSRSITVEAGRQTYHLICISRSNGALGVFSDMQKKFDSLRTDELEGMYNSVIGEGIEQFFSK